MPAFVISLGDPAGIGPEVTARAWEARVDAGLQPFVAMGDCESIRRVWDGPIQRIDDLAACAAVFGSALPVWHVENSGPCTPGTPTITGAQCALHTLELAVGLTRNGDALGLVTAPVCKGQLYQVGFSHPGQTEFVADRCGISHDNAVMMLAAAGGLRVVPVTVHVPLARVAEMLTVELIMAKAHATARGLMRSFGIDNPHIAVAGFNPHAGENGALGDEESRLIRPAIEQLQADGLNVSGPHSPDALFTPAARGGYDAALCLYHDQALAPFKALHFDDGVNVTLGLPIVRTSPDHGTAFDIAGRGMANPAPMIAALQMAATIAETRARSQPCPAQ